MGRETKSDIPLQLLTAARNDKSERVRYLAEMAWRKINAPIGVEEEVPTDLQAEASANRKR